MLKIIFTGPESSGKTTLSRFMSQRFNIPLSVEYAREYLSILEREYGEDDLLFIAKKQIILEEKAQILDTDLITIKVWSQYKYQNCHKWILKKIEEQKTENRFYILCKPDIPWQSDSLRENAHNRNELFTIYKDELEKLGHNYFIAKGKMRREKVEEKIQSLLSLECNN